MNSLTFMAVGDISLEIIDGKDPFEKVEMIFQESDILFGNLETVLSEEGERKRKAVVLNSNPKHVKYLKKAGFNILNVANNHILDLGKKGFNNTLEILSKNKIDFIGAKNEHFGSKSAIITKKGIKIGCLGYTIGRFTVPKTIEINKLKLEKILEDIECIKQRCDFLVVSLHWGTENVHYPHPHQIVVAHKIIDSGVNLILGHHPHAIQGIEEYNNGLIVYSLGNFQFHPHVAKLNSHKSLILKLNIQKNKIVNYNILPTEINDDFRPQLVHGLEKNKDKFFIDHISSCVESGKITKNWWFEVIAPQYLNDSLKSYKLRIKKYGLFHFLEFCVWLILPFTFRCYGAIIRTKLMR